MKKNYISPRISTLPMRPQAILLASITGTTEGSGMDVTPQVPTTNPSIFSDGMDIEESEN